MKKLKLLGAVCAYLLIAGSSAANAAALPLESRLGGLAYFDPNLNITWAANAGIVGADIWDQQVTWTTGLTLGGVSGWRLPSADVNGDGTIINCSGGSIVGCADNEMGYLFWEESITPSTPGPFSAIQNFDAYWSGTELTAGSGNAWYFAMGNGGQGTADKLFGFFTWAVHDGDVSAVPIPAAMWLFGSGLLALFGVTKRLA